MEKKNSNNNKLLDVWKFVTNMSIKALYSIVIAWCQQVFNSVFIFQLLKMKVLGISRIKFIIILVLQESENTI
jgi:hypothetical protein